MAVKSEINNSKNLTTHTLRGKISTRDVKGALEAFFDRNPTSNVLWDFRKAKSSGNIIHDDLREIARYVKDKESLINHGKTALVASSDLAFGLARTYEAFAETEGVPHFIKVFRSMDKATEWLEDAGDVTSG